MKDKHSEFDISDILREANEENELARAKQHVPKVTDDRFTKTLVAPAVGTQPDAEAEQPKKPHRDLDAETIELIDKYSTREFRDTKSKSDTQDLRETLARKLQDDKLVGFLDPKTGGARKAENLRTLIRRSDQMSADEMERRASAGDVADRFSDEEPSRESFEQAEMFPLGDGMTLKEQPKDKGSASFDRDYESLGKKVIEHGFEEPEDDGQLSFLPDETDVEPAAAEMDETEINLRLAFDMMQDGDAEAEAIRTETVKIKKRAGRRAEEEPILRYTDRSQNTEIACKLFGYRVGAMIRMILAAVMMLVLGWFELAQHGGALGELMTRGNTGLRLYLLIDLQLLFACGLCVLPSMVRGVRGFLTRRLVPESVLVFGMAVLTVYSVVLTVLCPEPDSIRLYGLTVALAAVCAAVADWQTASRNCHAFRTISVKKPKYIAERVQNATKEAEEFGRYLYEDSELYTVQKTGFVEGFSERSVKRSKYDDLFHFLLPLIFVGACGLFVAMMVLGRGFEESFRASIAVVAFSVPSTAFFMIPLPLTAANRKGKKCSGAFIGNGIAEEYSMASVLSFADTEVYPSNLVSVTSVKTYGDYRIDKVIPDVAKVFAYLGGPLAKVTSRMIDGQVEKPSSARVIENAKDGICVAIDGRHIFLGKRSYLRRYRFDAPVDQGDDGYENGVGSVMYVVIDEQLAAKFYIRYRINPRFEQLLQDLYRAGLCLGVKTMDPNITNEMIMGSIRFRKCPVAVLKQNDPSELSASSDRASGGVVCSSSLHNFLCMFSLCDKVRHVTKCNAIILTVSVILSALAVGFLAIAGDLQAFGVLQAVIFQLCWLLPVWILSFLAV